MTIWSAMTDSIPVPAIYLFAGLLIAFCIGYALGWRDRDWR